MNLCFIIKARWCLPRILGSSAIRQARPMTSVAEFLERCETARQPSPIRQSFANYPAANSKEIFVNNDTGLSYINVYGFDYDYTLANYNNALQSHIYELGTSSLIDQMGYPRALKERKFDPDFVIKGLHFDRTTGYLLKLDQFGEFQNDTILLGRDQVPPEIVSEVYQGRRMPRDCCDIFSLPEACLLADVVQHFRDLNAEFHPLYIYQDVRNALEGLHANGAIHRSIMDNPQLFLSKSTATKQYLKSLASAGKKVFLLSNSPFLFIDCGMRFIYGEDWRSLFDVIIVSAGKPAWFVRDSKFRRVEESGKLSLLRVNHLEKGQIYTQGSLSEFARLTGWRGDSVLYFGDHINSDLAEPQRLGAWKTAAVIKELEREIEITHSAQYRDNLQRLLLIEKLIADGQLFDDDAIDVVILGLKAERNEIRRKLKQCINKHFGSIFRSKIALTLGLRFSAINPTKLNFYQVHISVL